MAIGSHRTKLGHRTKGHRTNAGARLYVEQEHPLPLPAASWPMIAGPLLSPSCP